MASYIFTLYQTDAPINVAGSSGQEIIAIYTITVSDDDAFGIGDNDVGGGGVSETGAAPVLVNGDPSLPAGWSAGDTFYFGSDRNLSDQTVEDALLYPRVDDSWQSSYFALRQGADHYDVGDTLGTITFGTDTPSIGGSGSGTDEVTPQLVCFACDTLIEAEHGAMVVQDLVPGDMVLTRDHGLQPVRWIGVRRIDASDMAAQQNLWPVRIEAGALGAGTPEHDLYVSRQHRVLVRSRIAWRMFDAREVLVPAATLTALPGIDSVAPEGGLAYWHILFDRHEVIRSNGAWTESLLVGPRAISALPEEVRTRIGTLRAPTCGAEVAARMIPRGGKRLRKLAARHDKNGKPLYSSL